MLLTFCILPWGCVSSSKELLSDKKVSTEITLDKLLLKLPAQDSIEQKLIIRAILDHGKKGMEEICQRLTASDSLQRLQAQYALDGLSVYLSNSEKIQLHKEYVTVLSAALNSQMPIEQKTFLISQLQLCAGDEAVPVLANLLPNERLFDPALRALTAIGSPAAVQALTTALPHSNNEQTAALLMTLGNLKYELAATKIQQYINNQDSIISRAALFALANIGYEPSPDFFETYSSLFPPLPLFYAARLAEKVNYDQCAQICRRILINEQGRYRENERLQALTLLCGVQGIHAFIDLFEAYQSGDKRWRQTALDLAQNLGGSTLTQRWIELLSKVDAEHQQEIISMLARRGDTTAAPALRQALLADSLDARLAAIRAFALLLKESAAPDLIQLLKAESDVNTRRAVSEALLTLPAESYLPELIARFSILPDVTKITAIELFQERSAQRVCPLLISQLESGNSNLRLSALAALADLGDKEHIPPLLSFHRKVSLEADKTAAQKTIAAIANRTAAQKLSLELLSQSYDSLSIDQKIDALQLAQRLGGQGALEFVQKEMTGKTPQIREAALRAILDWQDESAFDVLLQIAQSKIDLSQRILAVRRAVHLLQTGDAAPERALQYYQRLMIIAPRTEEKKQILSALSSLKTAPALKYAGQFLSDPLLSETALQTVVNLTSKDEEGNEAFNGQQTALVLLSGLGTKQLQSALAEYQNKIDPLNQPPEGFAALFNGKDLSGWNGLVADPVQRARMSRAELQRAQAEADDLMNQHWKVIDGVLFFDGKGHSLCTANDYANFEMLIDWKIEKRGDSGVYLRGSPQVQIWDTAQWPQGSGGLYNNQKNPNQPLQLADNPTGEWNTFRIIMAGERVTVWLNGILVVNNVIMENYWERDKPIYPLGQIELQAHTTPLYLRNIFIRELPDEPALFEGALFNGVNLDGWQIIGDANQQWQVKDSVLFTEGEGGGWLSTTREFADFKLEMEFRLPPGGNSGVFIRTPLQGDPAYTGMEIQVLDDYADEYKNLKVWQYTGSIYGVQAPAQRVSKNAGQWQKMEITCRGPQVSVILNDVKIIDASLIDFGHLENTHPGLKHRKGFIGLQNHSTKIEYRNIRLTEIFPAAN